MADLILPKPLPHQVEPLLQDCLYKLWPWGRRGGKSRASLVAGIAGHGPGATYTRGHAPKYPGVLQGWDIVWVPKDYPQALTIWQEEIRPRLTGLPGVTLNEQKHEARFEGLGALILRSAEAVDGIRGMGARLGGVIIDEAGYQHLGYSWPSVLLPALLDNGGWCIFNGSPNAGRDGNPEHLTPSWFNTRCLAALAGTLGPEWGITQRTAQDNPVISPAAFQALVNEYPPDSPELAQEVYAKFITGGAGLAFPDFQPTRKGRAYHVRAMEAPKEWRWWASGDWGYAKPGWFGLAASGPENILLRRELYYQQQTPYKAGYSFGMLCRADTVQPPEYLALDSACFAVTDGGVTIAEGIQKGLDDALKSVARVPVIAAPKGSGSRIARKLALHEVLKAKTGTDGEVLLDADGHVPPWAMPALIVHPDCRDFIRTLAVLPKDERNSEDVDTDAEDHPFDGFTYGLLARTPQVDKRQVDTYKKGQHPGYHADGTRRRPQQPGRDAAYAAALDRTREIEDGTGFRTGWGMPAEGDYMSAGESDL